MKWNNTVINTPILHLHSKLTSQTFIRQNLILDAKNGLRIFQAYFLRKVKNMEPRRKKHYSYKKKACIRNKRFFDSFLWFQVSFWDPPGVLWGVKVVILGHFFGGFPHGCHSGVILDHLGRIWGGFGEGFGAFWQALGIILDGFLVSWQALCRHIGRPPGRQTFIRKPSPLPTYIAPCGMWRLPLRIK